MHPFQCPAYLTLTPKPFWRDSSIHIPPGRILRFDNTARWLVERMSCVIAQMDVNRPTRLTRLHEKEKTTGASTETNEKRRSYDGQLVLSLISIEVSYYSISVDITENWW
jgi:hypothetical protein